MKKKVIQMAAAGMTAGMGSLVVGKVGGPGAAGAQRGIGMTTRFMPVAGTAMGAGYALKHIKRIGKKRKKKR